MKYNPDVMIKQFTIFCRIERGLSETTLRTYRSTLNEFFMWMDSKGYLFEELTKEALSEWSQDMFMVSGLVNANTRGKKISNLRTFFSWAVMTDRLKENPAESLPIPKVPQKHPQVYTDDQLALLFSSFDENKPMELRNYCMLIVTYAAALRASELVHLDVNDIKDHTHFIALSIRGGKGAKDRTISIRALAAKVLRKWLMVRRELDAEPDPLFVSLRRGPGYEQGKRLGSQYFHDILKRHAPIMGLRDSDVFLHKLRSTGITDYYNSGRDKCERCGSKVHTVDHLELMRFSGHKDPKSLLRYVLITPRVQKLSIPKKTLDNIERKMEEIKNGGFNETSN